MRVQLNKMSWFSRRPESVVDYEGGEQCPLYSDSVLTPGDSTEQGAVPPSVIDHYAVAPPVPSLRDSRARDRLSHILDTVDDGVKMDEFSYVHETSDSDYDELVVDEDVERIGVVDTHADRGETFSSRPGCGFVSRTVDFTHSADCSGSRPRREIRRPHKYDDFETQFMR